jgi:hypothetical protein
MSGTALRSITSFRTHHGDEQSSDGPHEDRTCPVCAASDPVVKAALVVRSGRFRVRMADGNVGECESELARLLAEPPEPRSLPVRDVVAAVGLSWLLLVLDLLVVELLRAQDVVAIPTISLDVAFWSGLVWFGLLLPLVTLARFLERNVRLRSELPQWREAVNRWRDLYYCTFDDIVFARGSDAAPLTPEYAFQLWWPSGDQRPATKILEAN